MIPTNKGLIATVLGLGVVFAMGLGALITGLIIKAKDPIPPNPGTKFTEKRVSEQFIINPEEKIDINIPKGFRIKTATSNATHILLHIHSDKGQEEILIVEPGTGKVLGKYMIRSKK